jgi:protease-4
MDTPTPLGSGPSSQTIVIDRRERAGIFRRIVLPLLLLVFGLALITRIFGGSVGLPTPLSERYVAGDISGPKVAIVEVEGTISGPEVEYVLRQVRQARDDDLVKAIVVRIDSPGGTVSGADRIWRELSLVGKPVVASLGGMAASGGYYVAVPSQVIVAEPTTLTGSIGVILQLPQIGGLLDKVGVKMETVATGRWKDAGSMYHRELGAEERERWRSMIGASYDRFVRIVAKGRNLPVSAVEEVADGRVLTAEEALQKRLIDRIGYQDDAIREAWTLARLGSSRVIRYARPMDWTSGLLSMSSSTSPAGLVDVAAQAESMGVSVTGPRMLYLAQ